MMAHMRPMALRMTHFSGRPPIRTWPAVASRRTAIDRLLNTSAKSYAKGPHIPRNEHPLGPIDSTSTATPRMAPKASHPSSDATPPAFESSVPPSTPNQSPTSILPSLDFSSEDVPKTQTTRAKSAGESLSTIERRRRIYSRLGIAMIGLGLVGSYIYSGREWGEKENIPKVCRHRIN